MSKRNGERPPVPELLPAPVVDAHTHLDACGAKTAEDVRELVDRAASVGVARVVTVADDLASARWVARASTWDDRVFGAVALHPTRTSEFSDADRAELAELAAQPRIVAIGETGLDYYWDYAPHDAQQDAFRWHIELSKRVGKPLMIHDRDAHEDILRILTEQGAPSTVVFHCFSGDADFARRCVDAGYVLSFAGTVTFRNAAALREAAALVPLDQLLVETDAPFLTPHPFRGRPNEPYCAAYTLRDLAALRGMAVVDLANAVNGTADRVFQLRQVTEQPGSLR
ncbi:TatD family deoxyribonuclease [Solihabitans fulvus]|uniref:TatD family deoxyribonuclease n=1 Tax=Solihabitans fulvus TaxID=1892852 RepID=A0A5B2WMD9_9PSEU|nr:TatD family hydrolase [Solihabitans fulvus]KAA2252098.1 TatD family deoxyribonuclease [Solihabitans fulvus]